MLLWAFRPKISALLPYYSSVWMFKFIDIGANLTDTMYSGMYHGTQRHQPDLDNVLGRAKDAGLEKIVVTSGSLSEAVQAIKMVSRFDWLYATVGVHPTRCNEFLEASSPELHLETLAKLVESNKGKIIAIGECGLDYDRLQFCDKEVQLKFFELQLTLAEKYRLPLFLHCRASCTDLLKILSRREGHLHGGVVHSFDGTAEEAQQILDLGYDIGINGCSLKTPDNLSVAAGLPMERLHLETDAPWCEVRPSHAGYRHLRQEHIAAQCKKERWQPDAMVKSRNEPANIRHVLDILAGIKDQDPRELSRQIYENSMKMFFPDTLSQTNVKS